MFIDSDLLKLFKGQLNEHNSNSFAAASQNSISWLSCTPMTQSQSMATEKGSRFS